jgi:FtsH-binding integral membrane protein
VAAHFTDPGVIPNAALLTLLIFGGLTATVLLTRKDFSFLRGALMIGTLAAFGAIFGGILFGFTLGLFFSIVMVVLACGYILYYTSQILAHYRPSAYVAAALALFASVALLFWYVLSTLMHLSRD